MADPPADRDSPLASESLLSVSFTLTDLAGVRRAVDAVSRRCGLADDQVADWITVVNELMINVIRHGGGRGRLRLLLDGRLICEVTDQGPGFDTSRYVPPAERPSVSGTGGMGLWIVGQMAEFLLVRSGPEGTTIRVAARSSVNAG